MRRPRPIAAARAELVTAADAELCRAWSQRGGGCRGLDRSVRARLGHAAGRAPHDRLPATPWARTWSTRVAEALAPRLAELAGGKVGLRILTNLADRAGARHGARVPVQLADLATVPGRRAARCATPSWRPRTSPRLDPYRAATHNKGIMNGVDPVVIATGNDWRGIEAGAHAYAARTGRTARWPPGASTRRPGRPPRNAAGRGHRGRHAAVHPGARLAPAILGARPRPSWRASSAASAWRRTWRRCARWPAKASSAATWRCTAGQ